MWRRPRLPLLVAAAAFAAMLAGHAAADQLLGINPIFSQAENGDTAAVDYLLRKGQSIEDENQAGETVLNIAAANGYLDMVELAISNGGRIDHPDRYGKTALCWAAERGHYSVVERLIQARANINYQTQEGLTPLMLAVRADRAAVVQLLLRHKPNLGVLDYTGRDALGWARTGRDRRIETMLVRAGAKD